MEAVFVKGKDQGECPYYDTCKAYKNHGNHHVFTYISYHLLLRQPDFVMSRVTKATHCYGPQINPNHVLHTATGRKSTQTTRSIQ